MLLCCTDYRYIIMEMEAFTPFMVASREQNAAYGRAGWLYGSGVACTRGTEIVAEAAPESVLFCKKQKLENGRQRLSLEAPR